jgi:CheY-like chemotaxis protein
LSRRCRGLGLNVCSAENSLDLLNAMHEAAPSLACVDIQMPCGSGLSACEMIAADPNLARIPIIVMSGNCDSETIRRCWQLNACYVLKCADIWPKLEPLIREMLHLPGGGVAAKIGYGAGRDDA